MSAPQYDPIGFSGFDLQAVIGQTDPLVRITGMLDPDRYGVNLYPSQAGTLAQQQLGTSSPRFRIPGFGTGSSPGDAAARDMARMISGEWDPDTDPGASEYLGLMRGLRAGRNPKLQANLDRNNYLANNPAAAQAAYDGELRDAYTYASNILGDPYVLDSRTGFWLPNPGQRGISKGEDLKRRFANAALRHHPGVLTYSGMIDIAEGNRAGDPWRSLSGCGKTIEAGVTMWVVVEAGNATLGRGISALEARLSGAGARHLANAQHSYTAWARNEQAHAIRGLRAGGLSNAQIRQAIDSSVPGTMRPRIAGPSTFAARGYGGTAGPKSMYNSPSVNMSRAQVAPYEGSGYHNALDQIIQWQVEPGTVFMESRVATTYYASGAIRHTGGGLQWIIPPQSLLPVVPP